MAINLIKINEFPTATDLKSWMVVADANGTAFKISKADIIKELGVDSLSQFRGSIVPSSPAPSSGDFWVVATQADTYTNYGGIVVPANTFAVISRIGSTWASSMTDLNPDFDKLDDVVSALDFFINGYDKGSFIEEFLPDTSGLEDGIVTSTNGLRTSTTSFKAKRNYALGEAMFVEASVSAVSGNPTDTFLLGIKPGGAIDVLLSNTSGRVNGKVFDLSIYEKVSFSLPIVANESFKFFKGASVFSENNVKEYIDAVSDQLDGIVSEPQYVEAIIDSSFVGVERLNNTILKEDGTTSSSTGITTIFKIDVKKYTYANLELVTVGAGTGPIKNAVIVGYKSTGIVNLYPLPETGGATINEGFNISEFDFLSVSYGDSNAALFQLTLSGNETEPQQVKKFIDNNVTKRGAISSANNKFTLTRRGQILQISNTNLPSVYWPWIIETSNIVGALGKYYMYFSTDHASTSSAINLAYSDNLTNWTQYGTIVTALNQLGSAGECETPSVVWDDHAQEFRMYWQTRPDPSGQGYSQSTQISRGVDGINWTHIKTALSIPLASITGNGHNGYFTPIQYDNRYVALHLMGGTDQNYTTISFSYDGLNWLTSPMLISAQRHGVFAPDVYSGSFSEGAIFVYNGRIFSICGIGTQASGITPRNVNLGITEMCDDFVTVKGKAELLLEMNGTNENNDIRSIKCFQDIDGSMYVIYNCNGRFFLATLNANF